MRKSEDTRNYRKGNALQIGDVVSMAKLKDDGDIDYAAGRSFVTIASITKQDRNYRLYDVSRQWTSCVSGHEFAQGQFE